MILFSHPTGNANVRQAALALHEAGLLAEYWTCFAPDPAAAWLRLLPAATAARLTRRALLPELRARAHTTPFRELARLLASSLGLSPLTRHETGPLSVDAVYRALDRRVSRRVRKPFFTAAYAYEDGARETFRACRAQGKTCLYDLPIGYWRVWRGLLAEEREREPEWAGTLQGAGDSEEKLARKDEELQLADRIFVASTFTKETLAAAPAHRATIHVIPYGAPPLLHGEPETPRAGPLRVLFIGALSQRKGLSYLLKAVALAGAQVALTLIGTRSAAACPPLDRALREHRWIPTLPHGEILREMSRHDVFVFPSLFEGFGLVLLEALAQGLPVITTPHTAGPDLIEEGSDGFLVPIRSAEEIAARLHLLAADRERLRAMKHAACAKAATFHWSTYRSRLAALVSAVPGVGSLEKSAR